MNLKIERLKNDVLYELNAIEKIIENINSLNQEITSSGANMDKQTAIAAYLMNFYNGIENILKRIAKECYENVPAGETWHKDLLTLSTVGTRDTGPIISKELADKLYDYLGFRHFFVHGYSFMLDWDNLKDLIKNIGSIWPEVKLQINSFLSKL